MRIHYNCFVVFIRIKKKTQKKGTSNHKHVHVPERILHQLVAEAFLVETKAMAFLRKKFETEK